MTIKTALADATNALLDLQRADYNTFQRPLRRLAQALWAPELETVNTELTADLDLEAFLAGQERRNGMVGSDQLEWPDDRKTEMGLVLLMIRKGGEEPDWLMNMSHHWFYDGSKMIAGIRKMTSAVLIPFLRDYKAHVDSRARAIAPTDDEPSDFERVFVVHGHDDVAKLEVARFLEHIGLQPVILHEQVNRGMTVPEKLAAHSNVGFAVVLLTPDDVGRLASEKKLRPRARQNVILELGYFVAKLGRDKVCALRKGDLEIPSDYLGVAWTELDAAGGWHKDLARELEAAGYDIDWNKVMGKRT